MQHTIILSYDISKYTVLYNILDYIKGCQKVEYRRFESRSPFVNLYLYIFFKLY